MRYAGGVGRLRLCLLAVGGCLLAVGALHCGSEVTLYGNDGGGGTAGAGASTTTQDAGDDAQSDASGPCGGDALRAGFVVGTAIEPSHPAPQVDDYLLSGLISYKGPISVPISSSPEFDSEVRIRHVDGSESTLQYFLPLDLDLPVSLDAGYEITFRRRHIFESYATALVIMRPTSGLPPLQFIAEGGEYGRALENEDPLMAPLKVYPLEDPSCPTEPFEECDGTIYRDALRFDSSTGGMVTELTLHQAQSGTLAIFGDDFTIFNLASTRIQPTCPDGPGGRVSYLAITQTPL